MEINMVTFIHRERDENSFFFVFYFHFSQLNWIKVCFLCCSLLFKWLSNRQEKEKKKPKRIEIIKSQLVAFTYVWCPFIMISLLNDFYCFHLACGVVVFKPIKHFRWPFRNCSRKNKNIHRTGNKLNESLWALN